jgi:hypothetical protein
VAVVVGGLFFGGGSVITSVFRHRQTVQLKSAVPKDCHCAPDKPAAAFANTEDSASGMVNGSWKCLKYESNIY